MTGFFFGIPIAAGLVLKAALTYCDALEAADRAALFKTFAKIVAQRHGVMATFMAKWSNSVPGQSGHLHISMRTTQGASVFRHREQLFAPCAGILGADIRNLGPEARAFGRALVACRYGAPDGRQPRRQRVLHRLGVRRPCDGRGPASGFATSGLELGGKDPAYVRADAHLAQAIETLTDGAFYNAGQSCCGIKRIYVAAARYDEFLAGLVDLTSKYRLGSPLDPATTIGPVVRTSAADAVRNQVREALALGARQLIDESLFAASAAGTPYLAPQVLVDVDHSMSIMREETFGPAVGIMKVDSDEQSVRLMDDSEFGLTAAIFSADPAYRLRTADAAEVLSFQDADMSVTLRGNWNYPTTIWAGPGRIAELGAACALAGISRPLIVTDEGLVAAPMIQDALAALNNAALFGAVRGTLLRATSRPVCARIALDRTTASWLSAAARRSMGVRRLRSCRDRPGRCGISRISATGGRARIRPASHPWWRFPPPRGRVPRSAGRA
jgi:hypothetical protein